MFAHYERRARVYALLYLLAASVGSLLFLPATARGQLTLPVMDASQRIGAAPGGATAAPAVGLAAPVGRSASAGVVAGGGAPSAAPRGRAVAGTPAPADAATAPAMLPLRPSGFLARQLRFPRVRNAFERKAGRVAGLLRSKGLEAPAEVMFRVFKREQVLEVWGRDDEDGSFSLVRTYPICELSGRLGPKRREGDGQIPEGFYSIDMFNPWSDYHLSMRVDYPNAVDRFRGTRGDLGGDIFIHGGCATIGCVPVTDEWIQELYLLAAAARDAGQRRIPVHIFPTRLDQAGMRWLAGTYGREFVDFPFWQNLQEGYVAFERTHRPPSIGHYRGQYVVVPEGEAALPVDLMAQLR